MAFSIEWMLSFFFCSMTERGWFRYGFGTMTSTSRFLRTRPWLSPAVSGWVSVSFLALRNSSWWSYFDLSIKSKLSRGALGPCDRFLYERKLVYRFRSTCSRDLPFEPDEPVCHMLVAPYSSIRKSFHHSVIWTFYNTSSAIYRIWLCWLSFSQNINDKYTILTIN